VVAFGVDMRGRPLTARVSRVAFTSSYRVRVWDDDDYAIFRRSVTRRS
jgi:hypothetical protein